jgi:hypothetical protein
MIRNCAGVKFPELAKEIDDLRAKSGNEPLNTRRMQKEVGRFWDERHRMKKVAT